MCFRELLWQAAIWFLLPLLPLRLPPAQWKHPGKRSCSRVGFSWCSLWLDQYSLFMIAGDKARMIANLKLRQWVWAYWIADISLLDDVLAVECSLVAPTFYWIRNDICCPRYDYLAPSSTWFFNARAKAMEIIKKNSPILRGDNELLIVHGNVYELLDGTEGIFCLQIFGIFFTSLPNTPQVL